MTDERHRGVPGEVAHRLRDHTRRGAVRGGGGPSVRRGFAGGASLAADRPGAAFDAAGGREPGGLPRDRARGRSWRRRHRFSSGVGARGWCRGRCRSRRSRRSSGTASPRRRRSRRSCRTPTTRGSAPRRGTCCFSGTRRTTRSGSSATSWASPLPALWAKTSYLWTASDPALAAVNGEDGLPDLAIGRLPATTLEQAETLVGKLLAWEDSGQGLAGNGGPRGGQPGRGGGLRGGRGGHPGELPLGEGHDDAEAQRAGRRDASGDSRGLRRRGEPDELRGSRGGGGVGERERAELLGHALAPGSVAAAAAPDDELPERVLRGPELRRARRRRC